MPLFRALPTVLFWVVWALILVISGSTLGCGLSKRPGGLESVANPARVAVLDLGLDCHERFPSKNLLGVQIDVDAWRKAMRLLENDGAQVLIVRVRSDGGSLSSMASFQKFFQNECKEKFRTVAWIDRALGSSCLAILPIEEICFYPGGTLGPASNYVRCVVPLSEMTLEQEVILGEEAATQGRHSPFLCRALTTSEPLSVDFSDNGVAEWRQDELGLVLLNTRGNFFTLASARAIRVKFASGIASSRDEVVKAIGLTNVQWVGEAAADMLNESMRDRDAEFKSLIATLGNYRLKLAMADDSREAVRKTQLTGEAMSLLSTLAAALKTRPEMATQVDVSEEWLQNQQTILDRLQIDADKLKSNT